MSFLKTLVNTTVAYLDDQTKKATPLPRLCSHCNRKILRANLYVGNDYLCNCSICNEEVCNKCGDTSKNKIPKHLLYKNALDKSSSTSSSSQSIVSVPTVVVGNAISDDKKVDSINSTVIPNVNATTATATNTTNDNDDTADTKDDKIKNWLCNKCKPECDKIWLKEFQDNTHGKYDSIIDTYFYNDGRYQVFFHIPSIQEDNAKRKALRAVQVAEYGFAMAGYDAIFKVAKYAYYGREIYNTLIKAELLSVMKPIIDNLKIYGVKTDDYMTPLYLYYLSCKHQAIFNKDPGYESRGHNANDPGIIHEKCPTDLLDYAGKYLGAAQLLYIAHLHEPHHTNEWSSWYLTKLTSRQQYTVIMCQNETSLLRNGTKCPAFALLAKTSGAEKEVQLIIRGTHQVMDWSINLNEDPVLIPYANGKTREAIQIIEGWIHRGMYEGAIGILDDYCCYEYLSRFIKEGYKLKFIGHSLGAGSAAVIAAILKTRLYQSKPDIFDKADLSAIIFATPPVMDKELASAVASDGLVLSVILGLDCVPRFSKKNLAVIAEELSEFIPNAKKWYDEDYADVSTYVKSFGKARDPFSKSEEPEDNTLENNIKQVTAVAGSVMQAATVIQNAWVADAKEDGVFVDAKPVDEPVISPRDVSIQRLVSPGTLIHIYRDNNSYKAAVCDHTLPTLRKLDFLFDRGFSDHKMQSHWIAMRTLRHTNGNTKDTNKISYDDSKSNDSKNESKNKDCSDKNCSICGLDVTWAYITHSDASRSHVSRHCSVCNRLVCSICSPAGDEFKGDGIQSTVTLPDRRIVIPSATLEPQRVCAHCYLDSYDIV